MNRDQPEAGPSRLRGNQPYRAPVPGDIASDPNLEYITIPSIGFEYYKYRRALFLAGRKAPILPTPLPEYITVYKPPPPIPYIPKPMMVESGRSRKMAEGIILLEKHLDQPRAKQHAFVKARVLELETYLKSGKKMVRGTTLSFIIKVLKYGWIEEGLWPIDPVTQEPAVPADSPIQTELSLPDEEQEEGSASTTTERI